MFQTACGFEDFGMFVAPGEGLAFPGRFGKGGGVGFGAPVGVDDKPVNAVVSEVFERVCDERLVGDGDEGFGASSGERFEAGAEACSEDESGVGNVHGSIDPELSFAVAGNAFGVPRRIPHQFNVGASDAWQVGDALARFGGEDGAHAASWCGEGHCDVHFFACDVVCVFGGDAVDQAEVHDVDGDFGVIDVAQLFPHEIVGEGELGSVCADELGESECIGIVGLNAVEAAGAWGMDGVGIAEALGDDDFRALGNHHGRSGGDLDGLDGAEQVG